VVFRFITEPEPDEEAVRGAYELASPLERKAKEMQEFLTSRDLERERACEVMHVAPGLLRAVDELRSVKLDACQSKAKALMARVVDERRWPHFVQRIRSS
jgi:hypothetical protein